MHGPFTLKIWKTGKKHYRARNIRGSGAYWDVGGGEEAWIGRQNREFRSLISPMIVYSETDKPKMGVHRQFIDSIIFFNYTRDLYPCILIQFKKVWGLTFSYIFDIFAAQPRVRSLVTVLVFQSLVKTLVSISYVFVPWTCVGDIFRLLRNGKQRRPRVVLGNSRT